MFVSELICELSLPTQSKYVRLQIRGRQLIKLSAGETTHAQVWS